MGSEMCIRDRRSPTCSAPRGSSPNTSTCARAHRRCARRSARSPRGAHAPRGAKVELDASLSRVMLDWCTHKSIQRIAVWIDAHVLGSFVKAVMRVVSYIDVVREVLLGLGEYELHARLDHHMDLLLGGLVTNESLCKDGCCAVTGLAPRARACLRLTRAPRAAPRSSGPAPQICGWATFDLPVCASSGSHAGMQRACRLQRPPLARRRATAQSMHTATGGGARRRSARRVSERGGGGGRAARVPPPLLATARPRAHLLRAASTRSPDSEPPSMAFINSGMSF